ncbi:endonuclease I family protein [Elusimicrobiota bacterium]
MAHRLAAVLAFLLCAAPLGAQHVHVQVAPVPVGVAVPAVGAAPVAYNQSFQFSNSGVSVVPALSSPHILPTAGGLSPQVLPRTQVQSIGAALPSAKAIVRNAVTLRGRVRGANLVPTGGKGIGATLDQVRRSVPRGSSPGIAGTLEAEREERSVESGRTFNRLSSLFDGGERKTAAVNVAEPHASETYAKPTSETGRTSHRHEHLAETEGKRGTDLTQTLHDITKRGHNSVGYKEASKAMFSYVDNVIHNGVRGVKSLYSQIFVKGKGGDGGKYREHGDENGDHYVDNKGMNVEHLWPQSYFKQRAPMRSDLHHLYPAFQHPNSIRSRLPFGEVPANSVEYHTRSGAKMGAGMFEPPDAAKGRVARAMLYFYTRYLGYNILPRSAANNFWNSNIEMFLRWNRQFPPSAHEMERNNLIEEVQGNRNPFVDDHGLADRIGVEGFRMEGTSKKYITSGFEPMAPQQAQHKKNRKRKKRGHSKKNRKRR